MNPYVLNNITCCDKQDLLNHKRLSFSDNSTKQNSESLESHSLYNHSDEDNRMNKIYPCTHKGCKKQYSSKSRLLIHTRTHVNYI